MSLFICSKCECIENTALSYYWIRQEGEPPLCSECDPQIGRWHGAFPKQKVTQQDIDSGRVLRTSS